MNVEAQAGLLLTLGSMLFPRAQATPQNRNEAPWSSLDSPEAVIQSSQGRLGCREAVGRRAEYRNRGTGSTGNPGLLFVSLQYKGLLLLSPLWWRQQKFEAVAHTVSIVGLLPLLS